MKKLFTCVIFLLLFSAAAYPQLMYQPYSYQFYQKLNSAVYSPSNSEHTAIKPFLLRDESFTRHLYDSLLMLNVDNSKKSWLNHVLFTGHLAEVKNKDYTFSFDYLPDLQVGRDLENSKTTWLNTRGFQLYGTVAHNFFFYTSAYENQGVFANYEHNYINTVGMIPGQAFDKSYGKATKDWEYATALIGYAPCKAVTIVLGEDKTFIGDGYRSVLLSDYAASYPLLRVTVDFGKNVQYMAMWAYMEDQRAQQFNSFSNNRRKWAGFHYLDWNITNRASIGFFNAVMAEEATNEGKGHGFDANFIDPIYFSSSIGPTSQAPDHTLFGFNGKYKVLEKTTVYGQYLYDQASAANNNSSRFAWQAGFRGADLFNVKGLNYLFEYNTSKPYTYAASYPIVAYDELSEPLADPLGANFREGVGILNYSIGRFDLQGQLNYARYGLNVGSFNSGKDITLPDNINLPVLANLNGVETGQGLSTTLKYAEGTIAYVLNPKYNLRIEIGAILRQETNAQTNTKTAMITFGLRSTFRDLYHDF